MQKIQHYVLFPNHDNGMRLYGILKEAGIKTTIAPTPRVASKCCGISLLVREEDLDTIQKCIDENQIEILKLPPLNGISTRSGINIVKKYMRNEEILLWIILELISDLRHPKSL